MTGFVYAIGDDEGRVKIGWSSKPRSRLSHLRANNVAKLDLLGLVAASRGQETEIQLLLSPWKIRGEWFDLNAAPVRAFVDSLPSAPPIKRSGCRHSRANPVAAARMKLGESQWAFADRFGVNQSTVQRWEMHGVPKRGLAKFALERLFNEVGA